MVTVEHHQHLQDGKDIQLVVNAAGTYPGPSPEDGLGLQGGDARMSGSIQPEEDGSHGGSTQCSDVEDSVEGDEVWDSEFPVPAVPFRQYATNTDLELPSSEVPSFGDICVKNSSNVHLGNKTFYKGPITIKQIVYSNQPGTLKNGLSSDDPEAQDGTVSGEETTANPGAKDVEAGDRLPTIPRKPEEDKVTQCCNLLLTWRCMALLSALASCLVAATVVSFVILGREVPRTSTFPVIPDSGADNAITDNVRFIERRDWLAQPPTVPLNRLVLPVPYVIISHTATDFCRTQAECTHHVRLAQTFHIESRKFSDIAYNFLVGGDGYAYVGRGWDFEGAHAFGYNKKSIGISFIGTFNTDIPPNSQIHAAQKVIELGVKLGKISADYKLLGHRQVSQTESPGTALYTVLQKWPHWSPMP